MKTLIFGSGVIGSIYASRLFEANNDVTLLARGGRYEDIIRHGVHIRNILTGKQTTSFIRCIRELKPTDAYDLVIITVRLDQIDSVIPVLKANPHCPSSMPRWFSVLYWQRALKVETGTLAIAPHANAAKEEMRLLAQKVISMVPTSSIPTPTLDKLLLAFIQQ